MNVYAFQWRTTYACPVGDRKGDGGGGDGGGGDDLAISPGWIFIILYVLLSFYLSSGILSPSVHATVLVFKCAVWAV